MKTEQVPSIGRVVHYILESGPSRGQHRPAIIVRVWETGNFPAQPDTSCQLQVFMDGTNDGFPAEQYCYWATSRQQGEKPGTWHWPEHVGPIEVPD